MDSARKACSKFAIDELSGLFLRVGDVCRPGHADDIAGYFVAVVIILRFGDTAVLLTSLERGYHFTFNKGYTSVGIGYFGIFDKQAVNCLLHIILEPIAEADDIDPLSPSSGISTTEKTVSLD